MLLKLGTITAKFHQGPRALINLRVQISAGHWEGTPERRGGGVRRRTRSWGWGRWLTTAGAATMDSVPRFAQLMGPRASPLYTAAPGSGDFLHHLKRAWRSTIICVVVNPRTATAFQLHHGPKTQLNETNLGSEFHETMGVSLFYVTFLNDSGPAQLIIFYRLLCHF